MRETPTPTPTPTPLPANLPPPAPPPPSPQYLRRLLGVLIWLAPAVPAIGQLVLMLYTVVMRVGYPYDLEWMEGGLLGHASRIADRQGIYVEPSVEFIPYLYTPLYPALIALLGGIFGISYAVGRVLSILALLATCGFMVAAVVRQPNVHRRAAWCGGAVTVGLFAATYPWVEGWFDLVRADTLFVAMIIGGLVGVRAWARLPGDAGRRRIGAVAAVLALSFFCKQTGLFYVAAGGGALLVMSWRRLPIYIAVSAIIGLGGVWLFDRASGGWFWTYIYDVHQNHDFSMDRFKLSFGNILGQFPIMSAVIAGTLAAVLFTWILRGRRPSGAGTFIYWTAMFAVSCVVGAIGWATQWAHYNAYIPAMATGAIAAGTAVPAVVGAAAMWRHQPRWLAVAPAVGVAVALGAQLALVWWQPRELIPGASDREAGDALVARLRLIEGDVFMPYHPWYPVMAGKPLYTHRMGLLDVTYGNKWKVGGLREAFRTHRFAAVVLDDRPIGSELSGLREAYRLDDFLPQGESPRSFTGAKVAPRSVWVPARPLEVPPDAHVLFDFESGRLTEWKITGKAWGKFPASGPIGNQGPVRRYGGRYYASSYHGGDEATGTLTSPSFTVVGGRITFRMSGGNNEKRLRAELWINGTLEKIATATQSEGMEEVMWNVASYAGATATLVFVDDEKGSWGHLNVDEIWQWD